MPCWVMRTGDRSSASSSIILVACRFRVVTSWVFILVILKYHSVVSKPNFKRDESQSIASFPYCLFAGWRRPWRCGVCAGVARRVEAARLQRRESISSFLPPKFQVATSPFGGCLRVLTPAECLWRSNMQSSLVSLSNELAKLVEEFQSQVLAVHARAHYPSSGVHWRPGIVVTADHTVSRDEDIQVTLPSGNRVDATLVGCDSGTDIALLRVEGLGSPAVQGGGDTAKVGELALVLGRSPNSGPNASLGVISAVSGPWRTWRGGRLDHYIRLDATLFPTSSGAAVLDSRGQLLGIATSGLSRIAGLAIPASSINRVVDALLAKGHVPRGYLGIGVQPVAIPDAMRTSLSVTGKTGVMVVNVEPAGPADRAGVLLGDILLGIGDTPIEQIEELQSFSDSGVIGTTVKAKLIRAGALREVAITVGERPGK